MDWLFAQTSVPAWLLILLQWSGFGIGLWWGWMEWRRPGLRYRGEE